MAATDAARLREAIAGAERGTIREVCGALADVGAEATGIVELNNERTAAAQLRGHVQVPVESLGRTAREVIAIRCAAAACAGGILLVDDAEPGSRLSAAALWKAMTHAVDKHGCQVLTATSSPRLLRAAVESERDDVAAYSRIDQCTTGTPAATRHDHENLVTQVDYNLLD